MAAIAPHVVDADVPFPRFSIAERDRRWRLVRELMARDGLDAVIAPENTAAMIAAMVRDGGELPTMVSWFSGPPGNRAQRLAMASERIITNPWYISNEIEGRLAGYVSQRMQPLYIGP